MAAAASQERPETGHAPVPHTAPIDNLGQFDGVRLIFDGFAARARDPAFPTWVGGHYGNGPLMPVR